MKNFQIVLVLSVLFCLNCEDKTDNTEDEVLKAALAEANTIKAKDIETFRFKDYILSKDAKKATLGWAKFQELETQLSFLKKGDVTFFTSDADTLKAFLNTYKSTLPLVLKTNPIEARIVVLETTLLQFNSNLSLDNYAKEKRLESIKALLTANANLIYLINKKLEFDGNDVERPAGIAAPKSTELPENIELLEDIEIIE